MHDLMDVAMAEMERGLEAELRYEYDQLRQREHSLQLLRDEIDVRNHLWHFFYGGSHAQRQRSRPTARAVGHAVPVHLDSGSGGDFNLGKVALVEAA